MSHSIVFLAPSAALGEVFTEVCRECGKNIRVIIGELEDGVSEARELMKDGIDAIISRGGTALAIRRYIEDIPVVDIPITGFDVIRAIEEARRQTDRVLVVGFRPFTCGLEGWEELLGVRLKVLTLEEMTHHQPDLIDRELLESKAQGFDIVVGDTFSIKLAARLGMKGILIRSGKEALMQAIAEAERVAVVRRLEMEKTRKIKCITDFSYEGIIGIDGSGAVSLFNPSAEKILGISAERVVGRNVEEVLPGLELLDHLRSDRRELGKVMAFGDTRIAANIIPVRINEEVGKVIVTFQKVSGIQSIERKIRRDLAQSGLTAEHTFQEIIGESRVMRRLRSEAEEYAQFDLPVLLYGETGTGKELFAQAIHNASARKHAPFVAFNCAALPESLLESELFGYAEGTFTGGSKGGKAGIFEQAHGGTIFLDEIAEISVETQVRLLRVLEERRVRRLGDNKLIPVDVRIITATNRDLRREVEQGGFRQDLFYRINVLVLDLPALRDRSEDIPPLCEWLVRRCAPLFGRDVREIAPEALHILQGYGWPGNVRQLENVIERMIIKTRGKRIGLATALEALGCEQGFHRDNAGKEEVQSERSAPPVGTDPTSSSTMELPMDVSLEDMERLIIEQAIRKANGNKNAAARQLGIGRTTLWRKLKN